MVLIFFLRMVLTPFKVISYPPNLVGASKGIHNMYVCMCNPFTDKDVKNALENPDICNTPAQIYKACAGGNGPNCGTCIHMVKDLIVDHQSTSALQKLIDDLPEVIVAEDEFVPAE